MESDQFSTTFSSNRSELWWLLSWFGTKFESRWTQLLANAAVGNAFPCILRGPGGGSGASFSWFGSHFYRKWINIFMETDQFSTTFLQIGVDPWLLFHDSGPSLRAAGPSFSQMLLWTMLFHVFWEVPGEHSGQAFHDPGVIVTGSWSTFPWKRISFLWLFLRTGVNPWWLFSWFGTKFESRWI